MLSKQFILPSLTSLLFLHGPLLADEQAQENAEVSIEGHVSVRSREMDPSTSELMENQRDSEDADDQALTQRTLRKASNKLTSNENQFMLASPRVVRPEFVQASYAFPVNCHWLTSISDNSRSLEMEDGSHWEISPSDAYILRGWRREDSLVVTPNTGWLSSYGYYITNKSNNSYVRANLYVGPLAFGPYSHWVVEVDHFGGHIYLENQMIWCVNPQDSHILKDWAVNDHVIFGLYSSWFTPYDHILINVNMNNYIRVKQY